MSKTKCMVLLVTMAAISVAVLSAHAQVQPCPGHNPVSNTNLACEIVTSLQSNSGNPAQTLNSFSPTLATQLSQLPKATAISGTGLTISGSTGVPTASTESLGTILTQRGETLGKNKWYVSLTYQRFNFSSIDGISLKHFPVVDTLTNSSGSESIATIARARIDLLVDQFVAIGSYGITKHIDLTVAVPFANVTLKSGSQVNAVAIGATQQVLPVGGPNNVTFFAGSANGPGDVSAGIKANLFDGENAKFAVGGEIRFPTGDATNYLGTGAYGFKPYMVFSRTGKRFTPNINLAYQWNSTSVLFIDPNNGAQQNLPSSFLYSGGVDFRALRRLTFTTEFIGQAVINGPRLIQTNQALPQGLGSAPSITNSFGTYAMDNIGVGFKFSPHKGWLISGNTLFALDEGGLRSKVVPLVGISYRH